MTNNWTSVARAEDLTEGASILVSLGKKKIVVTLLEGEPFAYSAFCTHAGGPMERAENQGVIVTCPLHGWRFDLRDRGREIHGYRSLETFKVKMADGQVLVHA